MLTYNFSEYNPRISWMKWVKRELEGSAKTKKWKKEIMCVKQVYMDMTWK
jgi:hypothetical protein